MSKPVPPTDDNIFISGEVRTAADTLLQLSTDSIPTDFPGQASTQAAFSFQIPLDMIDQLAAAKSFTDSSWSHAGRAIINQKNSLTSGIAVCDSRT